MAGGVATSACPLCAIAIVILPTAIEPTRWLVEVLAGTLTDSACGPDPALGATVNQAGAMAVPAVVTTGCALPCAVHGHPTDTASEICRDCAAAVSVSVFGLALNVHGIPACEIVNVWPATTTVPLRDDGDGLAWADNETSPKPYRSARMEPMIALPAL